MTVKAHTDHEIEQFKKQLAANKERIEQLQKQREQAAPSSYQYFKTAKDIRSLNDENALLNARIHATIQTSYARYKSHYPNHELVS